MSDDELIEQIIGIFKDAGITIDIGATYSVKCQIAQLLNGVEKIRQHDHAKLKSLIETLKASDEAYEAAYVNVTVNEAVKLIDDYYGENA